MIDRDKLIEMAKEAGFRVNNFTVGGKEHFEICAIGTTCKVELDKFASLVSAHAITSMQGDSEPVAKVIHTKGIGLMAGKTIPKVMLDIKYTDLPAGTQLYLHADRVKGVSDKQLILVATKAANLMQKKCFDLSEKYPEEKLTARICAIHYPQIINEAVAEVSQLSTNTDGWVSVSDRLPEEGTLVLMNVPAWGQILYTGYINHDDGWHDADGELIKGFNSPTHWQSLPAPPAISQDKGESV